MFVRIAVIIVVLVGLVSADQVASAASRATGNFSSSVLPAAECTSAIGICTRGTLTGGLKGEFSFVGTSLMPSADTPTTGVVFYTGDLTLTTKDGELRCKDAGALLTTGAGAVSSVCVIVGGTGGFAGATGTIQFTGTFTSASGGDGEYRAEYALP